MENNIFGLLSALMGQKNQAQNQMQNQSEATNPAFANYPREAYQPEQTATIAGFSKPNDDGISNMLPMLLQLMGGKGDLSVIESLMKGGKIAPSRIFKSS